VASLSQGRTAAAQCGLFTYKSVPVIFEPPCTRLLLGVEWPSPRKVKQEARLHYLLLLLLFNLLTISHVHNNNTVECSSN